jgi:hypothetical protein
MAAPSGVPAGQLIRVWDSLPNLDARTDYREFSCRDLSKDDGNHPNKLQREIRTFHIRRLRSFTQTEDRAPAMFGG